MKVACILLLACVAGLASAAPKEVTFSPPSTIPSPPPPTAPGTPPLPTFSSPGLDFSVIVPGYSTASFGTAQQTALCSSITNNWNTTTSAVSCTVGSVSAFNGTGVLVSGYAYFTYSAVPTITELQTAAALRDARVVLLTTNSTAVLGAAFPGAYTNCACNGITAVTTPSTSAFTYSTNITGVPGPMQCGAKLTYDGSANAQVNQVGIDNGSINPANLGKYCSTPAVTGGVVGVPGSGSCTQYGVQASATGTTQAAATATVGTGAVSGVSPLTGGSGYSTAPTVTISAPSPIAAQAAFTLSTAFQPVTAATISTTPNGPYSTAPTVASLSNTCIDTSNTAGGVVSGKCSGSVIDYQVNGVNRRGAICLAADIAQPSLIAGGSISTTPSGLTFPSAGANIYCTATPIITLSTNTLQPAVNAQATATISSGVVTAINIISPGSGYLSTPVPTITISAPIADYIGKLCSLSPILSLPASIAYSVAAGTISPTGACQPLGRDTVANAVCSIPAAPNGGLYAPVNAGTCNVVSSFIAQPGSTVTNTCAAVPQTFTVTVAAAPAPAPKPAPAPTPAPTPAPAPPTTCTYSGIYNIGSVACAGKFIAYNNDPKSNNACTNSTLMLRTDSQSKGNRKHWTINASAVSGTVPTAIGVIASGRTTKCPNNKYTNLAAANSSPTPRLAGSGWKNRIIPVDAAKGCDTVWIQAVGDNPYAGKYLGYGSCSSQTAFKWEAASSSSAIQWKLTRA